MAVNVKILKNTPGTFRFRIFASFLMALLPLLIFLAVTTEFYLIPSLKKSVKQDLTNSTGLLTSSIRASAGVTIRNHLKAIAEKNREVAEQHLALVEQGILSKEDAVKRLKSIFLSQRIGSSGYIYCLDSGGFTVVHPKEAVEDTDNTRFDFVREQLKSKEGYLEYDWRNPGESSPRPKALYMVYFEPLDWIISVSSYKSEFYELLDPRDFREAVASLQFGESGYAYVFNQDGKILIHPKLNYLNNLSQEASISEILKPMLFRGSGIIEYAWRNPEEPENRRKIAVFESMSEYGWTIVSSAYLDEVMKPVNLLKRTIYFSIFIVLIAAGLATFFLSGRLSRPINAILQQLDRNAQSGTHEPMVINFHGELGRLAFEFNSFLKMIASQSELLRTERERYQSLFESSPDAIILLRRITLIDCNTATCSLFNSDKNTLIGLTIKDLSPPVQAHDENSGILAEIVAQQSMQQNLQTFEWVHKTADGRVFDAEVRLKPFGNENGEPLLVAFVRDITERKKVEESLRLTQFIFDKASIGIYQSDSNGQILNLNEQACKSLGYTKSELCRMSLFDIDPSLSVERLKELQKRKSGTSPLFFESVHRSKDGRVYPVKITSNLMEYKNKQYSISFARDITEEKQKEKQKQRMEAQFYQAQRMEALGTLAGGIAHDFNNILSAIIGYTELSQRACPDNAKVQSYLSHLHEASERAKNLVQQILSFSRQGNSEMHPIDISRVINEALRMIRVSVPTTIEISQNIRPNLGTVYANETQIHQIVMNLCANSCHAMEETGGCLEIDLIPAIIGNKDISNYPDLNPGHYLKFVVADTGHGISPDQIQRVFDPYFTTKQAGKGSGLGLSTVHGIVKDHGGSIKVYSELNKGTTFQIFLPLAEVEEHYSLKPKGNLPRGNESILYVDDEKLLVDIGKRLLESLGYSVETRVSSIDAYEAFRAHPDKYDLIVTDMTMPKLTGENLAIKIKKILPGIPIILCTGYSTRLNTDRLKNIGVKQVLMKPVTLAELATAVRTALDEAKVNGVNGKPDNSQQMT
jgi:PAS domain S-box-containing protein